MYAVICNPQYWKYIEDVIILRDEQILIKSIDSDINVTVEFEKIERVPVKYLIIDITSIQDSDNLLRVIRKHRILHDETHIIILAPNCIPGDKTINSLVTMGIYNILSPTGNTTEELAISISLSLTDVLDNPYSYKKAVKWVLGEESIHLKENIIIEKNYIKGIDSIKERLVGTITIAVGNIQHGSGATHTALTIAKFLSGKGFKVGVVELKQKSDYGLIYLPRKITYNEYSFKYENFDIYANDGEATPDDLFIAAISKNYNYIVLDVGLIFEHDFKNAKFDKPSTQIKKYEKGNFYNEFMKADVKIVNTFASTQFADSIEYLLNYLNVWGITDLKILFNFTNEEALKGYKKLLDFKLYLSPYNTTLSLTEDQNDFYGMLLEKIIPKNRTVKEGMKIGSSIRYGVSLLSKGVDNALKLIKR